jgi:hypothetical protein
MKLQYQMSNGSWVDCGERTEQFLARCVKFGGLTDEAAVLAALAAGETVRNHNEDWYSKCRDGDVHAASLAAARAQLDAKEAADKRPMLRCNSCGATGRAGAYPFSTLAGSGRCDDCV